MASISSSPSSPPKRSCTDRSRPMPMPIHASASTSRSGSIAAGGLRTAEHPGDVVVHLAEVAPEVAPDLLVVGRLAQCVQPELRGGKPSPAQARDRPRDCQHPAGRVGLRRDLLLDRLAQAAPDLVHAGEKELALRAEVAVEDRLRHACSAGDLSSRRTAVRAGREDRERRIDDRRSAVGRRQTRPRDRHRAGSAERLVVLVLADGEDCHRGAAQRDARGDVEGEVIAVDELLRPQTAAGWSDRPGWRRSRP